MKMYEFTVVLRGNIELTEDVAEKLYLAGCDDGTPGTCGGAFQIDFHREGPTMEHAINSAIANVKSAGFDVAKVEMLPELIPV